jgi:hypothetical protein
MRISPYQEDPLLRHSIYLLCEAWLLGHIFVHIYTCYVFIDFKNFIIFFWKIDDFFEKISKKIQKNLFKKLISLKPLFSEKK